METYKVFPVNEHIVVVPDETNKEAVQFLEILGDNQYDDEYDFEGAEHQNWNGQALILSQQGAEGVSEMIFRPQFLELSNALKDAIREYVPSLVN